MGNHENDSHDNTEGNRQYYPKGWYLPLIGLAAIALGFALLGGTILGISGTDKWGKKAECTEQCKDGEKCKEGEKCKDGANCKDANCKEHEHGDMKQDEKKDEVKPDAAAKDEAPKSDAPAGEQK